MYIKHTNIRVYCIQYYADTKLGIHHNTDTFNTRRTQFTILNSYAFRNYLAKF